MRKEERGKESLSPSPSGSIGALPVLLLRRLPGTFFRSCSETFFTSRIAKFAVVANSSYAVQLIMCVFLHQSPFYALPEKQVPKVEITDPALFSAIFCRFFRGSDTLRGRS